MVFFLSWNVERCNLHASSVKFSIKLYINYSEDQNLK